jgi:acyl carrier protein
MVIEREFDLEIPDADARVMYTAGDMNDFVHRSLVQRARDTGMPLPDESQLWDRVLDIIVEEIGAERHKLVRNARFVVDLGVN